MTRCRICDQTGKSFIIANKDRICRLCTHMMQLTVTSLSEHWSDIVTERKSLRMREYYKNVLVYEKSKIHRHGARFRGHVEDFI